MNLRWIFGGEVMLRTPKRKRVATEEIFNKLFQSMNDLKVCTASNLASETGLILQTVEKYMGLIKNIQEKPRIGISSSEKFTEIIYILKE